jgi:hypothetical protein
MIKGITDILVNRPRIKKREQKNSAKITKVREKVLPIPMKFKKVVWIELKRSNLSYPWAIIKKPKLSLKKNIAAEKAPALYLIDNSLFIFNILDS